MEMNEDMMSGEIDRAMAEERISTIVAEAVVAGVEAWKKNDEVPPQ